MKADKETGAPQFTQNELEHMGRKLKGYDDPKSINYRACVVTIDDLNLFLRANAMRLKRKKVLEGK